MLRYAFIAMLMLMLLQNASALSEGDACSLKDQMPRHFVCFENAVNDCRAPQGRIGYMVCSGEKVNELELQMSAQYAKALRSFERPPDEGVDFVAAKEALVKSQRSWRRYAQADCALGEALFGPGNAGAPAAMDCQVDHLKSRIRKLQSLHLSGK